MFSTNWLFSGVLLIFLLGFSPSKPSSKEIIDQMFAAIPQINSLTFTLKKKERVANNYNFGEQNVKYQSKPKKIYTEIISPNKGIELLWREGQNNNMVYLNPNGFPYINLNFNPYSSTLRKGNHHTIHEVGFDYIGSIIGHIAHQCGEDFSKIFIYEGDVIFDKKECYKILINYSDFKHISYTVKENESLTDIAYKLFVSDYLLLQLNPEVSNYNDVKVGQKIIVSTAYAKKTILYIDKISFLPILQSMYDDKGLIAQYEFYNLQLNPKIQASEFEADYKDYRFK